jgi:dihydroxyacetone kinase DhaKLM complex PTS-EIIA-like component DhaM
MESQPQAAAMVARVTLILRLVVMVDLGAAVAAVKMLLHALAAQETRQALRLRRASMVGLVLAAAMLRQLVAAAVRAKQAGMRLPTRTAAQAVMVLHLTFPARR